MSTEQTSSTSNQPVKPSTNIRQRINSKGISLFSIYAESYWAKGLKIIPVQNKRPIPGVGWKHLIDHPQTISHLEHLIQYTDEHFNLAEVGIAAIMTETFAGIDVDIDDKNLLEMCNFTSPLVKRGGKGYTAFVSHKNLPKYRDAKLAIELLSKGTICVLPPSVHSIDKETNEITYYRWIGALKNGLMEMESITDLPVIDVDQWEEFLNYCQQNHKIRPKIKTMDRADILQGEIGRNIELFNKACFWLENHALKVDSVGDKELSACAEYLVNLDKLLYAGNEYFLNDSDCTKFQTPFAAAQYMATRAWSNMEKRTIVGDGSKIVAEKIKSMGETRSIDEDFEDNMDDLTQMAPTHKEWESIIPPSGILAYQYEQYLNNTGMPFAGYGLFAALGVLSTVMSNKIRSEISFMDINWKTYPNLYLLCIGDTGIGKNDILKTASQTLGSITEASSMLASEIASGPGLLLGLKHSRTRSSLIISDEFFDEFGNMSTKDKIMGMMLKLFAMGGARYSGKSSINKESKQVAIWNPHLNILAVSTAKGLQHVISERANDMGLLNRFLYCARFLEEKELSPFEKLMKINEKEYEIGQKKEKEALFSSNSCHKRLYDYLIKEIKLNDAVAVSDNPDSHLERSVITECLEVADIDTVRRLGYYGKKFSNPAAAIEAILEDRSCGSDFDTLKKDSVVNHLKTLGSRGGEMLNKLAMLSSVSDDKPTRMGSNCITESDYIWAAKVYEFSLRSFIASLGPLLSIGGKAVGLDEGVEYLRSKIDSGTGDFKTKRKSVMKWFQRKYGAGDSVYNLDKCERLVKKNPFTGTDRKYIDDI